MKEINLPQKIAFGNHSIKVDEFYVREARGSEDFSNGLPTNLQFGFATGDDNDHIAKLKLTIAAESISDEEIETPLKAVFYASIELLNEDTNEPLDPFESSDLPKPLQAMLLGIALGTARGELQARTAGFTVGKSTLPIFNPTELVESMRES